MSIGLIIWSFFEPAQFNKQLPMIGGSFCLAVSFLLLFLYRPKSFSPALNTQNLAIENQDYCRRSPKRNLILTDREFIFKTANSEIAWSWQAVKSLKEDNNGFTLCFYSGHRRFIPASAFNDGEQQEYFKDFIEAKQTNYYTYQSKGKTGYLLSPKDYLKAWQLHRQQGKDSILKR